MCLQVPIPIRNDKMVTVILLPRIRTRDIVGSTTGGDASTRTAGIDDAEVAVRQPNVAFAALQSLIRRMFSRRQNFRVYGVSSVPV